MRSNKWDFDFEKVKEHLTTLSGTKEKIKYLMGEKTEYKQAKIWMDWDKTITPFDKQCQLEIDRLNDVLKLEGEPEKVTTPAVKEYNTIEKQPIKWTGTVGQIVYLFEQLRDMDFLPASMDLQAAIKDHFIDSDGKSFTALKQSKQNYLDSKTGKPKRAGDLEMLVDKVKDSD